MGNKIKYPDDVLRTVVPTDAARELAADLWHEARVERIYAIIQLHLNSAKERAS